MEPYQRNVPYNEKVIDWFSNGHAENNIAIVTGRISRIIALDIDGEEASLISIEQLNHLMMKY